MSKKSVYIAMPAYSFLVYSTAVESLVNTVLYFAQNEIPSSLSIQSLPDITDARNYFATSFFDSTDHTHLLFLDADIDFPWQLIRDMLEFDHPVMGSLYPYKKFPISFVGVPPDDSGVADLKQGFMKMKGLGAGVLMIKREVIAKMIEREPKLIGKVPFEFSKNIKDKPERILKVFEKMDDNGYTISEDLSFCRRAIDCGFPVYGNIEHEMGHTGAHSFRGKYENLLKLGSKDGQEEK